MSSSVLAGERGSARPFSPQTWDGRRVSGDAGSDGNLQMVGQCQEKSGKEGNQRPPMSM